MAPDGTAITTVISPQGIDESAERPLPSKEAAPPATRPATPDPAPVLDRISSSPLSPSHNPFSDPRTNHSVSPPSSPPPAELSPPPPELSPPTTKAHKPAFSFLKRKRTPSSSTPTQPLSDTSESATNARSAPDRGSAEGKPPQQKRPKTWTQMRLDLGGSATRSCAMCGMEYVPSNDEDAALHRKFHAKHARTRGVVKGVDLGKDFACFKEKDTVPGAGGATVVRVNGASTKAEQRKAEVILAMLQAELGAASISPDELWGRRAPTYNVYLYCEETKCVGACLVESLRTDGHAVSRAAPTDAPDAVAVRSSSISTEPCDDPVSLGISRIWTARAHRGKGVARALLEHVRTHYYCGIKLPREQIAFSQPTESGGRLAERWFGKATGWHVYESTH